MGKSLLLYVLCLLIALGTLSAQTTLTNSDLVKMSKAGLSEDFITNLIDTQGSRLASDPSALISLKNDGVNVRIISAVVRKAHGGDARTLDRVLGLKPCCADTDGRAADDESGTDLWHWKRETHGAMIRRTSASFAPSRSRAVSRLRSPSPS